MGIKNFSKIFEGKEIKMKDIKDLNIIVDASVIAYQSALCMKNINALTDADGNPTIHINVVIAKCLNFYKYSKDQMWVFDYHEKGYVNPAKTYELDKRKKIKETAEKKLKDLKEKKDDLFSSDDEDENSKIEEKINLQEKICFSVNDKIINDIKFILNCFNIPWCDAPKGYEAEAICAFLTNSEQLKNSSAVWTTDTDAIIYGADKLIREIKIAKKKKLILYDLDKILDDKDIDMDDLRKIAVISGSDHAPKTAGIGAKTIFKKFKDVTLTEQQKKAVKVFEKTFDVSKLNWNNISTQGEFIIQKDKINQLLDWLSAKNFNKERIQKQIDKALK